MCVWGGEEEIYPPPIALNLKKNTKTSDYQSNVPPPKFIRSPFLDIPYAPPGNNLQPLPWGLWGGGGCHSERHNFQTFHQYWTKWLPQNFDKMRLGKRWAWEGGKLPSNHVRLLKRDLAPSNSNQMSPFRGFCNNSFNTKV